MKDITLLYSLDLVGTFVFAISGLRLAAKKEMDIFGASVIAFATALGGGTTRDILLGNYPVTWVGDINYPLAILLSLPFTFIFRKHIVYMKRTFFLFDTIGIALFTISGMQKALTLGIHPGLAIVMGVISAVVGGVIRDILCNEIPLIFRKEIYATACLVGAISFFFLDYYNVFTSEINYIITIFIIILIRITTLHYHWSLPKMKA